jgi:sialidase-1
MKHFFDLTIKSMSMRSMLLIVAAAMLLFTGCAVKRETATVHHTVKLDAELLIRPVLVGKPSTELVNILVENSGTSTENLQTLSLTTSIVGFQPMANAQLYYCGQKPGSLRREMIATGVNSSGTIKFSTDFKLEMGLHYFIVGFTPKHNADISQTFTISKISAEFKGKPKQICTPENSERKIRFGNVMRAAGDDNCHTYRIPGLITTNKGTLIAVYDNRYNNSKDLQEDIDVGLSRSTDGGQTWEPMKVIMDMGEYGGRPQQLNGIGDPCVLYDHNTGTIWVAALWLSGSHKDKMAWWDSAPGMEPGVTGQFMITKSTDDGLSWSAPINITSQIKDPAWQLLLQGPGMGITTKNGTLIFPAQFKADIGVKALDGGQYTSHSTIVYSTDGGTRWHIGTGAKPNTTEAQVVELSDGSLMLNMRDDLNRREKGYANGRAVFITNNLGQTWETHPTSNGALPEANCMASLIAADIKVNGTMQKVLFFSNPNHNSRRAHMTIKASLDQGMTWPEEYQLELNEDDGYGYSCLTMIDENTIGIIYEGVRDIYFQKIPVSAILKTTNP